MPVTDAAGRIEVLTTVAIKISLQRCDSLYSGGYFSTFQRKVLRISSG
jgi:hypothetical protein